MPTVAEEGAAWNSLSETRLSQLISSNEPPLDSELPSILEALSTSDTTTRRDELRGVLSPLRRVPPELLAEIFQMSLPPKDSENERDLEFSIASAPWVFTHVCARWRSVAIRTRSLWSRVAVVFFEEAGSKVYPLSLLALHLERGASFTVDFQTSHTRPPEPQQHVFDLLAQHAEKWTELFIVLAVPFVPALEALRGRIPALRKIRLEWSGPHPSSPEKPLFLRCLEDAPSLSEVRILNDEELVPIPFNTINLTWYCLDAPWRTHAEILSAAPSLETAYIHVDFDSNWPDWTELVQETILVPRLRRLFVSVPGILDHLRAPLLEGVAFLTHGDEQEYIPYLSSLLDRSRATSSSIKSLRLAGAPTQPGVAAFLAAFPGIKDLHLFFDTPPESTTDWAQVRGIMKFLMTSGSPLAHNIHCISFIIEGPNELDPDVFLMMVRSRLQTEPRALRRVKLVTEDPTVKTSDGRKIWAALADMSRCKGLEYTYVDGDEDADLSAGSHGDQCMFYAEESRL